MTTPPSLASFNLIIIEGAYVHNRRDSTADIINTPVHELKSLLSEKHHFWGSDMKLYADSITKHERAFACTINRSTLQETMHSPMQW